MRVYISVDMEGIAGINHPHPTDPTDRRYPESVALMIGETNAAIEGALAAGATDILVNDSHWNMYNLLPAEVHPSARVLQGPEGMVDGGGRAADRRTVSRRSMSPCSSATTRAQGTRAGRSPTRTRACRSRPASTAVRPASTG